MGDAAKTRRRVGEDQQLFSGGMRPKFECASATMQSAAYLKTSKVILCMPHLSRGTHARRRGPRVDDGAAPHAEAPLEVADLGKLCRRCLQDFISDAAAAGSMEQERTRVKPRGALKNSILSLYLCKTPRREQSKAQCAGAHLCSRRDALCSAGR
jgi:hypothetical protein